MPGRVFPGRGQGRFLPTWTLPLPQAQIQAGILFFFLLQKCADQELQIIQGIMVLTLQSHSKIVPPPAPHQVHPLLHCESSFAQNNETAVTQSDSVSLLPAEGICSQVLVIPSLLTRFPQTLCKQHGVLPAPHGPHLNEMTPVHLNLACFEVVGTILKPISTSSFIKFSL